MKKLLREPLAHFLLGGAALFLLHGLVAVDSGAGPDQIVVGETQVRNLARTFERTWMRPPTSGELAGLIDDFVKEEVLYREALALGLDQNDLIVRRRLRQKMEFLHEGLTEEATPADAELQAYLDAHEAMFREPPRTSFEQVFVSPEKPGDPKARAAALLERLRADPELDTGELGDATLLPRALERASPREISASFGARFDESLGAAPESSWTGPLDSGFGLHLVRIGAREPARVPALDEVRRIVEREWFAAQRGEANDHFYRQLRERYEVEVRMPAEDRGADRLP
jgi:hypothetical protein